MGRPYKEVSAFFKKFLVLYFNPQSLLNHLFFNNVSYGSICLELRALVLCIVTNVVSMVGVTGAGGQDGRRRLAKQGPKGGMRSATNRRRRLEAGGAVPR